jgi:hypothetical protein
MKKLFVGILSILGVTQASTYYTDAKLEAISKISEDNLLVLDSAKNIQKQENSETAWHYSHSSHSSHVSHVSHHSHYSSR